MNTCPIPGLDWTQAHVGETLPADTPRLFQRHDSAVTTFTPNAAEDILVSSDGTGQFWTEKPLGVSLGAADFGEHRINVVDYDGTIYRQAVRTKTMWLLTDTDDDRSRWATDHDLFVSFEHPDDEPNPLDEAHHGRRRATYYRDFNGEPPVHILVRHGFECWGDEGKDARGGTSLSRWSHDYIIEFV